MTVNRAKEILVTAKLGPTVRKALKVLLPDLDFQNLPSNDLPNEIWRDIKNYDKKYQVSNFARVKSFHKGDVRILKPELVKGYLRVGLYKNGKTKNHFVHSLVAQAFIPNPENKPLVNHIDGNRLNNNIANLEWCTPRENVQHALRLGLQKSGCEVHNSKLTKCQVCEIRRDCIPGDLELGFTAFSKKFNVNISTISDAYHRVTYRNVD